MKTKQSRLIVVVHAYMCLLKAGVWRGSAGLFPPQIVGIECAQLHLNFTVQKHWDIMCLFVHLFGIEMISFMFKALMVLTFGVITNKYVKLWYASCFFLFFFPSLDTRCSRLLKII